MKHIDIIIPTRHRYVKLQRCIQSIPAKIDNISLSLIVICDGDRNTAGRLLQDNNGLISKIIYVQQHSGSVYCRNLATQTVEDALIYATDDIEFKKGAIEAAINAMREHFPDEDGVIGFNQINTTNFSMAGVGLVGQKFLRRYPNRKLFYPGYFHFSCQEIERLGKKLDRIKLEPKAEIYHYHPGKDKSEQDTTHEEARRYRAKELRMSSDRRAHQAIWGDREK